MKSLVDCNKVYVKNGPLGLGVYAQKPIEKGAIIEVGLMTPLVNVDGNENPHLHTWSDDRKTWACSSGCLAFYNHSDNPDAKKVGDLKNNTIVVYALRDIKADEEIRTKYMSKQWRQCFQDF